MVRGCQIDRICILCDMAFGVEISGKYTIRAQNHTWTNMKHFGGW